MDSNSIAPPNDTQTVQSLISSTPVNPLQGGLRAPSLTELAAANNFNNADSSNSSLSDLQNSMATNAQNSSYMKTAQQFQQQLNQVSQKNIPQEQKSSQPKKESALDKWLPTLTGTGAGILGAVLAPETGGLSALLIPAAAAALGGGLGQTAANANAHEKALQGNVLTSAIGQGVGELGGGLLGKGVGLAGNALKASGEAALEKAATPSAADLADQALSKTKSFNSAFTGFENENQPIQDMLEKHHIDTDLSGAGENAVQAATNLRGKANTLANAISEPIQQIRDEEVLNSGNGRMISLPKDAMQKVIADIKQYPITGNRIDPFTQGLTGNPTGGAGGGGAGTTDDLIAAAKAAQKKAKDAPGKLDSIDSTPTPNKQLMSNAQTIEADIKRIFQMPSPEGETGMVVDPKTGEMSGQVSVQHALNIKRQLSSLTDMMYQRATGAEGDITSPERKALAQIAGRAEDAVGDQLYNSPGVLEAIQGRSSEALRATRDALTQAGFDNNQIDEAVKTSEGILNSKAVAPAASKAAGETSDDMNGKLSDFIGNARVSAAAQKYGSNSGKVKEAIQSDAAQAAKKSEAREAKAAKGSGVKTAAKVIAPGILDATHHPVAAGVLGAGELLANPAVRAGAGGVLSKLGSRVGMGALGAGGALLGSAPGFAESLPTNAPIQAVSGGQSMDQSPYAQELNALIAQAMRPSGFDYTSAGPQAASILSSLGPQLMTQVQDANKAQAEAQTVQNLFNQAQGGQGGLSGLMNRLGQTFTGGLVGMLPGQNQLGAEEKSLGGIFQNATPGAAPPAMPNVMSNQGTAQNALQGIQALIQSMYGQGSGLNPQSM